MALDVFPEKKERVTTDASQQGWGMREKNLKQIWREDGKKKRFNTSITTSMKFKFCEVTAYCSSQTF